MSHNAKLSTDPYKGVRDFYPEDMRIQNYITQTMKKAVEGFGYREYNASPLEPYELYQAKSGEEIAEEQTYRFTDKGGRDVALRPEMTPTASRMLAGRIRDLPLPVRWYSIPNVFRYERPQKGRLREHYQLNVDLFGGDTEAADREMVLVIHDIMKQFGATHTDFTILINDRELLSSIFTHFGVPGDRVADVSRLLDKKSKIEETALKDAMVDLVGEDVALPLLDTLTSSEYVLETLGPDHPAVAKLLSLMESLNRFGVTNVIFDPTLVRGFDYYTGFVFEVFDTNPENRRSLFGGGRYDTLTSLFIEDVVPAVGFGLGDVTFREFLEGHNLLPTFSSSTDLSLLCTDQQHYEHAYTLARNLKAHMVRVEVDISGRKLAQQIKRADRQGVPFVLVIGDDEVKSGNYRIKNLASGEEAVVTQDEIAPHISSTLGSMNS